MRTKICMVAALALLAIALGAVWWIADRDETSADWRPFVFDPPAYPVEATSELDGGFYLDEIQPIFNRRCIACHGCLDAPCLLKLTSYEGLIRGARRGNPDGTHLFAETPVRLYDAPGLDAWRRRGFCAVVDQNSPPDERLGKSVLFRMLVAGVERNEPGFSLQPLEDVYDKIDKHICPCGDGIDEYLKQRPTAGMPFAMPSIASDELETFTRWIKAGSPGPTVAAMGQLRRIKHPEVVARWEAFFNQPDNDRSPLVSRYIFEHVFLAILAFDEAPGEFFQLVRSPTPSAEFPIREIITARPFDTPYVDGVERFYYRLKKVTEPRVQKSFFLWSLNDAMLARLTELFFDVAWSSDKSRNPGYTSHNPFEVFQAIPARSRSLFLLENSKVIASGMIRGPVCVGNLATYAIKDNFWVFFVDPDSDPSVLEPELGLKSWYDFMDFEMWGNANYEEAYAKTLGSYKPEGYAIDDIWNGGMHNPNAWLTILRNETNATVMQRRHGGIPPTFWLMDYSGLERLYYALVADYEYWGSLEEKVLTWEFMGALRQEYEDNFLRLLPIAERQKYRDLWTRGVGQELLFTMPFSEEDAPTEVDIAALDPMSSVLTQIQRRLTQGVSGPPDALNTADKPVVDFADPITTVAEWTAAISTLTTRTHLGFTQYLPSITFVRLQIGDRNEVYTLIANRSYAFNDVIFDENGARQPQLDTMSVYHGLVGDFPNLLISLDIAQASQFLSELSVIKTSDDWRAWKEKYGVMRNSGEFWTTFDWFTDWNFTNRHGEAGYFDLRYYNLLDSRY